ncbi:PadR family transcriptional regulator [Sphaerisporangium sp. NPDC005288]|uniref:PadR family transcriptional regulator n=1 Tax=Sphaerisporangium sp. NPDC005288 TaxID=3155114 RepID=UPI0033B6EA0C
MAKRRKVGNLLALAILGTVVQRPMHPYEMASMLRARGKDHDMRVKWGSLYTVVRNLERHGFLEAVESTRQGGRPERTVYRITDAGQEEMRDWTRELLSDPEPEWSSFQAGLSVMGSLPPDEVAGLLRRRLRLLAEETATRREALDHDRQDVPRLFLIEDEYELAVREAEAAWVSALLEELTAGSFPGQAGWRDYHRTGRIPPDLAEIAERGSTADPDR